MRRRPSDPLAQAPSITWRSWVGAASLVTVWAVSCSDGSNKKHVKVPLPDAAAGMSGAADSSGGVDSGSTSVPSGGAGGAPESRAGAAGAADTANAGAAGEGSVACSPDTCPEGACVLGECWPTVTIARNVNLSVDAVSDRTCAEAIAYSVTALTADEATLSTTPAAGCLAPDDEVLVIDLQGTLAAHGNVGNWELARIARVNAQTVQFTTAKARFYGGSANTDTGIGITATSQRVALIRVPRFGKLIVDAGATITANAWNGVLGGVVVLRAGELDLAGSISAASLGYRPGRWSLDDNGCAQSVQTESGESIGGLGSPSSAANLGASGGLSAFTMSFNTNTPLLSSPGHAQAGQLGFNAAPRTLGAPGGAYGVADASQLTFGSGPGGGLLCLNPPPQTTPSLYVWTSVQAGGIALILADDLEIAATGAVSAAPPDPGRDISFSGGYVYVRGTTLAVGTGRISALGTTGRGGAGGPTANDMNLASPGYVVLEGSTVTGTSTPPAHVLTP